MWIVVAGTEGVEVGQESYYLALLGLGASGAAVTPRWGRELSINEIQD